MNEKPKRIIKWVVLACLLAYCVGMCVWAADISTVEKCHYLKVSIGNSGTSDSVVQQGVRRIMKRFDAEIKGKPLASINTRRIEEYLRKWNNFETVEVSLSSKGILHIDVTQMVPELRVFDGATSYYINGDGKRIKADADFFCDVPVISGRFSEDFPPQALFPVTRAIAKDPVMRNLVTMVKADDPDNIILIPTIRGHVINIGDTTNLPTKFKKIMAMYKRVMPVKGWQTYDTINVKFRGQIVASKTDKSLPVHTLATEADDDADEAALQSADLGQKPDSAYFRNRNNFN